MAISKSTPYVRYKKDFTSSLHLGTIHIESEYLDRTQKTTIESIHGMTWHNKVVNENKELNLLSDTQLELTELEKQYWNTGEKRVSVDEIHTLEEVEPNEDGTYTYTVNSMEGEYIEIYDGINNITSTSDGLDGQFEIVYDTTEEDMNGNIALDSVAPQYEITDSGVGAITNAKSTGLTLVNNITEPSKEEVVAIEEYEGQYFTIDNTVQGNIKSAILKGQTLVNLLNVKTVSASKSKVLNMGLKSNTKYIFIADIMNDNENQFNGKYVYSDETMGDDFALVNGANNGKVTNVFTTPNKGKEIINMNVYFVDSVVDKPMSVDNVVIIEYQEGMENWDIPYFEGMVSVKMPVLSTTGKNLFDGEFDLKISSSHTWSKNFIKVLPNTSYIFSHQGSDSSKEVDKTEYYNEKFELIGYQDIDNSVTTPSDCHYIKFRYHLMDQDLSKVENTQLEQGTVATSYEPFKSNILTVNEEVELRGIGNVQDELNLSTGELTQSLVERVFDGTENWIIGGTGDNYKLFRCEGYADMVKSSNIIVSDKYAFSTLNNASSNLNITYSTTTGKLCIVTSQVDLSLDDFKSKLSVDKPRVQYQLAEKVVKTVDLTVQNQDGGTIPHIQTQPTITHVSTSSDGLTPVVEMSCSYGTIIKPNTTYTIKLDRPIVSDTMYLQVDLGGTIMMLDADVNAFTIKTPSTLSHSQLRLSGTGNTVKEIIVLEGNRVNDKIEYFEGMKNVENPILIVSNCPYVFGKGGRI